MKKLTLVLAAVFALASVSVFANEHHGKKHKDAAHAEGAHKGKKAKGHGEEAAPADAPAAAEAPAGGEATH